MKKLSEVGVSGKRQFVAFTLAEVLITLAIIGVVAAISMPALIQNYRKHVVETRLAKVYSVMNQAINMVAAESGPPSDWFFPIQVLTHSSSSIDNIEKWFNDYIGKHLNVVKTERVEDGFLIYFPDGSALKILREYVHDMLYYIDQNAIKNPKAGVNSFLFRYNPVFLPSQSVAANKYTIKPTFEPYLYGWDGTMNGLLHTPNKVSGCGEELNRFCTKLIQVNGWKIPKDYPLKF